MESGAHAGLQTAAEVTAALETRQATERARFLADGDALSGRVAETIYRDASGRVINIAMKRAEARRKAAAEEALAEQRTEAQRGAVQRARRDEHRRDVRDAKFLTVARYADDEGLNEELRGRVRWDDPTPRKEKPIYDLKYKKKKKHPKKKHAKDLRIGGT